MPSRTPLCLVYNPHLREWRAVQTETKARGIQVSCAIFLRAPTPAEERAVRSAVTLKPAKVLYLSHLLPEGLQADLESQVAENASALDLTNLLEADNE